jgi:hypothetical protein
VTAHGFSWIDWDAAAQYCLARGYSGLGDGAKAVAFARRALTRAPDEPNRKNIESLIQQWSAPAAR